MKLLVLSGCGRTFLGNAELQEEGVEAPILREREKKQIEIDRRLLKNRIEVLQRELDEVRAHRATQRISRNRSEIPFLLSLGIPMLENRPF